MKKTISTKLVLGTLIGEWNECSEAHAYYMATKDYKAADCLQEGLFALLDSMDALGFQLWKDYVEMRMPSDKGGVKFIYWRYELCGD